jgi:hypothetical protein
MKFIDKICTKRHKKSGQTTEGDPGWMRPERAINGLLPWKQDDYDDDDSLFQGTTNAFIVLTMLLFCY